MKIFPETGTPLALPGAMSLTCVVPSGEQSLLHSS